MLITCIVYTVLIGVGVYKYDAKQLATGEDKQQDAQPLLEERTLGSATLVELVNAMQMKCENELYMYTCK